MLIDKQKKAAFLLFNGMKVQNAAAVLGVHRCTVWRWTHSKEFRKEWNRLARMQRAKNKREVQRERLQKKLDMLNISLDELEQKMHYAADHVQGGDTRQFNAAWNRYSKVLFEAGKLETLIQFFDD